MNAFVILGAIGPWELIVLVFAIILLFGGKKIPELMKGIGQGIQEFKKASNPNATEEKEKESEKPKTDETK
ncbi:MAG TPA: twin-arginine translocase TatA/TatE family subunit [Bacteroidales bacterium]|nr:twin-arginine translocase TatA/TatE family subunit [Bacteroidales bacterium]